MITIRIVEAPCPLVIVEENGEKIALASSDSAGELMQLFEVVLGKAGYKLNHDKLYMDMSLWVGKFEKTE